METIKEHDVVALVDDVLGSGLRSGDLGTVVHCYAGGVLEVEFANRSGGAVAIVTLERKGVRPLRGDDRPSVRGVMESAQSD